MRDHLSADEVDLGPGAALLSPTVAESLTPSPDGPEPTEGGEDSSSDEEGTTGKTPAGDGDGAGDGSQRRVSLTIKATEDDLHTLQRALTGLRDVVKPGPMQIELNVTAEHPEDAIDPVQFQNRVRQHLEEDKDVTFEERWE